MSTRKVTLNAEAPKKARAKKENASSFLNIQLDFEVEGRVIVSFTKSLFFRRFFILLLLLCNVIFITRQLTNPIHLQYSVLNTPLPLLNTSRHAIA